MTTIVNYRAKKELDDFEVIQSKITANALFNFMREYLLIRFKIEIDWFNLSVENEKDGDYHLKKKIF